MCDEAARKRRSSNKRHAPAGAMGRERLHVHSEGVENEPVGRQRAGVRTRVQDFPAVNRS